MVRIQLETGYLDIKENVNFPLNFGVADIRDVASRSGATSKTIVATGSKNNNELLNHYYDVNIVAGTFDINALCKCYIIQNGVPVGDEWYLQLLSVKKVQDNANYEDEVEYELMVRDAQADFFTQLNNKYLDELDFSDLNHVIDSTAVKDSFANTITDGYKYVLPWSLDNQYPIKEMRPAIYAKKYFDAIFATNGFSYDWSTSAAAKFEKLLIPYNGDLPIADYSLYNVIADSSTGDIDTPTIGTSATFVNQITTWTEVVDGQNLFDPTTGEYSSPFYVDSGESIVFNFNANVELILNNTSGADAYLQGSVAGGYIFTPIIHMYVNGVYYITSLPLAFYTKNTGATPLPNGLNTVIAPIDVSCSLPVSGLVPTDVIEVYIGVRVTQQGFVNWRDANSPSGALVQVDTHLDVASITMNVLPSTNIIGTGSVIDMNRFIPKKILQKDFVKGILNMFNLYVEVDQTEPNTLILQHRDDYYDSGVERDWTDKLVKNQEQSLAFLPEVSSKKLILTYKADKDLPNTNYTVQTNEIYGQIEYTFDSEHERGVATKEMLFSPTPVGQTIFGAYVPFIAGSAPKTNIRILLDGGTSTCGAFDIYDYSNIGEIGLTTYPVIGHFDNPINPTFDLNFATCDYYYYNGVYPTNNNLYNKYWRRTVNQINTGKMLTAYFDLTELDIQKMRMNDKIRIDNSWWNINKVIDYNCAMPSYTKVELISIDTEIDFAPFNRRIPKLPNNSQIAHITNDIISTGVANNNVVMLGAEVDIKGRGNVVIGGVRASIIGDNNVVTEDGVYSQDQAVGENFANTDLTVTGTRVHNLDGNIVGFTEGNTIFQNNVGVINPVVSVIGEDDTALYLYANDGSKLSLDSGNGLVRMVLPTYADDTSAGAGGLTMGMLYQTATGELRIKL